jgi:hypothetical protein
MDTIAKYGEEDDNDNFSCDAKRKQMFDDKYHVQNRTRSVPLVPASNNTTVALSNTAKTSLAPLSNTNYSQSPSCYNTNPTLSRLVPLVPSSKSTIVALSNNAKTSLVPLSNTNHGQSSSRHYTNLTPSRGEDKKQISTSSSSVDNETSKRIFQLYNNSGYINIPEFQKLIKDLITLKSKKIVAVNEGYLNSITGLLWFQIGGGQRIMLSKFVESVQTKRPFDYISEKISELLQDTLLTYFAVSNKLLLDTIQPFIPSWETKAIHYWQSIPRGCTSILNLNGEKSAHICDPLHLELFMTNARHTDGFPITSIRIQLGRYDNVSVLLEKIRGNWPGLRNRSFVCPSISQLSFRRNGVTVPESLTTEKLKLFYISAEYRVVVGR